MNVPSAISHPRKHNLTSTTDHNPTGLTLSQLLRLNSAGTAIESAGITIADLIAGTWNISTIPTRQSADDPTYVLRFAADMTTTLELGMILTVVQSTTKFFFVTAIGSFSGGNTDVTVFGGTDYDVADTGVTAITSIKYSLRGVKPTGFPFDEDKWSLTLTDTTDRSQSSPTSTTVYNIGSLSLDIHIGKWKVTFEVQMYGDSTSTTATINTNLDAGISTANNSFSDDTYVARHNYKATVSSATVAGSTTFHRRNTITLASKTTFYTNARLTMTGGTPSSIFFGNATSDLKLKAVCAYL